MTDEILLDDPALAPWLISADRFPPDSSLHEVLVFAVRYAVLAPSSCNAQPWLFRIRDHHLELHADDSRALPVVDPDDRELVISCGAALENLTLALTYFGYRPQVQLLPDPAKPHLLAEVRLGAAARISPDDQRLFNQITRRRTNRAAFADRPLPAQLEAQLQQEAGSRGAWLLPISPEHRAALAGLVAEGDRAQMDDRRFRRELAAWMRGNRSHRHDGMRGYAVGLGEVMSAASPLVIRRFDIGDRRAARDEDLATGGGELAVLGTDTDSPLDRLRTGQALQRVLLRARSTDVWASFLNQPIEVDELRPQLSRLLEHEGRPQLLLRLGYGPEPLPEPRRQVSEVLL
jgi:hypothetical protein